MAKTRTSHGVDAFTAFLLRGIDLTSQSIATKNAKVIGKAANQERGQPQAYGTAQTTNAMPA